VLPELNAGVMIQTSISLPKKYRLEVNLVKRRGDTVSKNPFLPSFQDIANVRKGSKVSRVFAHIFSHRHLKRLLGGNIAVAIILTSFAPVSATFDEVELNTITTESVTTKTEKGTQYPVEGVIKINQGYKFFHPGIDIDGEIGDPVYPIMAGEVKAIQFSKYAYGNAIIIDHGGDLSSLYAHLSKIEVSEGDSVAKSAEIGQIGSTGHSTGPHLHLEVHQNDRTINPLSVLPK
jgi:murein DD-endopeptidase MepM/ murein hydrolase activator NlpD